MKYAKYLFFLLMGTGLTNCSTREIEAWPETQGYVWFSDTINTFTFMESGTPVGQTYKVPVPLQVAAAPLEHDRYVNVEIAEPPRHPDTQVELVSPVIFRANRLTDTLYVNVVNGAHLSTRPDTLGLRIRTSTDFNTGLPKYTTTRLVVFNGLPRPTWWDVNAEYYLGYFTQLKMQIYIAVTGGSEKPYDADGYAGNRFLYLRFKLNDYVKKNDIVYPDDDSHAPGKQPSFSNRSF